MGFTDFVSDTGLTALDQWLSTRSYITGYTPSQADVVCFKAISTPPVAKFPHAARWYKHIKSFDAEFGGLPGDASAAYSTYGPSVVATTINPAKAPEKAEEEDDDVDLFGSESEEEDPEAVRIREERLAEYKKKKEGKTKPAAKSIITLDVKPWDDETDMDALTKAVLSVEMPGLVWGGHKLVAVGYGIKKLQLNAVVEDDKVSEDDLRAHIEGFEDYVQSMDVAAMQKL